MSSHRTATTQPNMYSPPSTKILELHLPYFSLSVSAAAAAAAQYSLSTFTHTCSLLLFEHMGRNTWLSVGVVNKHSSFTSWAMLGKSKQTQAHFSLFWPCLQLTQVPKCRDLAILMPITDDGQTNRNFPLAHASSVITTLNEAQSQTAWFTINTKFGLNAV